MAHPGKVKSMITWGIGYVCLQGGSTHSSATVRSLPKSKKAARCFQAQCEINNLSFDGFKSLAPKTFKLEVPEPVAYIKYYFRQPLIHQARHHGIFEWQ